MKKFSLIFRCAMLLILSSIVYSQPLNNPGNLPIDGLIAYYPFNGNANDESGNGNTGEVYEAQLVDDRFGNFNKAFSFDGANDYIEVSHSSTLMLGEDYSISLFFKTRDNQGGYILNKGYEGSAPHFWVGVESHITFANEVGVYSAIGSTININDNKWHHFVGIKRGDTLKVFVDGMFSDENIFPGLETANSDRPLRIGTRGDLAGYSFYHGVIDDIRIYNRALSSGEINVLYTEGGWTGNQVGNLLAYYPFNGNANDESGNDNNGTLYGVTTVSDRFGNENSAFSFDGIDDKIEIGDVDYLDGKSEVTISFWLNYTDHGSNTYDPFITKGPIAQWEGSYNIYYSNENDKISAGFIQGWDYGSVSSTNQSFADGMWHHLVVKLKSDTTKIFVDTIQVSNVLTSDCHSIQNVSDPLVFGYNFRSGNQHHWFKGQLDDIRIYDKELTTEEISELFHENGWTGEYNNSLIAYYPFNGNANDESGNGNDGAVNGASLTVDRFGNSNSAYFFDGNSEINFGDVDILDGLSSASVVTWVKYSQNSGQVDPIISKGGIARHETFGLGGFNWDNGGMRSEFGEDGNIISVASTLNQYNDGQWHQIVTTLENKVVKIFVDNLLISTGTVSNVTSIKNTLDDLLVGASITSGSKEHFIGQIDDIRIYNYSLSESEIDTLFHSFGWMGNDNVQIPMFTDIRVSSGTGGGHSPYGQGCAFVDINQDDLMDLHVTTTTGADYIFQNNGDNTFTDVLSSLGIDSQNHDNTSYGDFNNDGLVDILIAGYSGGDNKTRLYKNIGNSFIDISDSAFQENSLGLYALFYDLNKDGFLDIISSFYILLNNRDETFIDITDSTGITFIKNNSIRPYIADTDNDGDLDIIMMKVNETIKYYTNNGDLTFTDITSQTNIPTSVDGYHDLDFGDIDNDGDLDIYIGNAGTNYLLRNDGGNYYTDISNSSGAVNTGPNTGLGRGTRASTFADINNDGFLDIYVSNYKQPNSMYLNNKNNTFTDVSVQTQTNDGGAGHASAFADIDNDGDLEIYDANSEGSNPLYLNEGTTNNWLKIKLVGRVSNKSAIGARLFAFVGDLILLRETSRGTTICNQNLTPVHFGLGMNSQVDSLIIYWPSGVIQALNSLTSNQTMTIIEPYQNSLPVAVAGKDTTYQTIYSSGATIILDGSNSWDPNGDSLSFLWSWNDTSTVGMKPNIHFPLGMTTVILTVNDGRGGISTDEVIINVIGADLSVTPDEYNFGDVEVGNSVVTDFELVNYGTGCLEISSFNIIGKDSTEFKILNGGNSISINPNESYILEIEFNPITDPLSIKSADLKIVSNSMDNENQFIHLNGQGVPLLNTPYVFFANNKITIAKRTEETSGDLFSNNKIVFEKGKPSVHTGNLYAVNKIRIKTNNTIDGNVECGGDININGNSMIFGSVKENSNISILNFPDISFEAGGENITVEKDSILILLPGSYDKIKVKKNAELYLLSGQYFINALRFEKYAKLVVNIEDGSTIINIVNKLKFKKGVTVQILPLGDAGSRYLTFNYLNSKKISIDKECEILGNFIAPNANFQIGKDVLFIGSISAENIKAKKNVNFMFHFLEDSLNKKSTNQHLNKEFTFLPKEFSLSQNFPNPFNPSTNISFSISQAGSFEINIYNILGENVAVLGKDYYTPGRYSIQFTADYLPSGIYIYQLKGEQVNITKKMLLLK